MNVVLGQALRWWVKPLAQLDDVVRVIDAGDDRLLLVIAAGYDGSFSTAWSTGARLLLDRFEDAWRTRGQVATAFTDACAAYLAEAPPLVTPDDDLGGPAGSLMVAELAPGGVTVTWIGEHRAVLLRDGEQLVIAPSHTLGTQLAAEGHALSQYANVLTRVIGIKDAEPETRREQLRAGDTLLLLGGAAARLDADLAGRNADAIVTRAMGTREPRPSNAVALIAYIG